MIPDKKKNFNKILLIGAIIFTATQFTTGPVSFVPVPNPPSQAQFYWTLAGLSLGGVGGAFVLPYGMPALDENL